MRRIKYFQIIFSLCLAGLLSGFAPNLFAQKAPIFDVSPAQHVDWSCSTSKSADFKVGDVVTVKFKGHVTDDGWHLYSAIEGIAYNPTAFYPDEDGGLKDIKTVGGMTENRKAHVVYEPLFSDSVRFFHDHDVTFSQKFKVTGPKPEIKGVFAFQTCSDPEGDAQCIFADLPFEWKLLMAADGGAQENGNPENNGTGETDPVTNDTQIAASESLQTDVDTNPTITTDAGTQGSSVTTMIPETETQADGCGDEPLWLVFLTSFLFGFAAVLTPCVFPMIPLTVSFFTKQSGTRSKGVRNALLYGFFIIFIYTVIGLAVSVTFGEEFLYVMSTNPWVNLAFFILLFVFALSFFGMFEITLPSSFVNKIDSQSDRGGIIGIFFMALTLAVVSFSCTGPLVGTALIEAANGCLWGPTMAMLGFSSAIAIPFCIFAVFPGLMNSMPKSGGWLNSVKVVLGFIELALGFKFLSQTDLYMGWHILDREIFIGGWIVIFGALGLYLLGKIQLPHDSPVEKLSVPRLILAMCSFWFMFYLVPGLWGANLAFISGILPPHNADVGVKVLGQKEMNEGVFNGKVCNYPDRKYIDIFAPKEHHGFCAFYDLDQAIDFAKKENMPLFLDFTGNTCANCRLMENNVWVVPEVEEVLKNEYVMVSLYADQRTSLGEPEYVAGKKVTTIGGKWRAFQKANYQTIAQPQYVLMDPFEAVNGPVKSNLQEPVGYTGEEEVYLEFLKAGVEEFRKRHPQH